MEHTNSSAATAADVSMRFHLLTSHEARDSEVTLSAPVTKSSSITKGTATAAAKGQPTIAPEAKASVANSVRRVLLSVEGSTAYANASVFAYIANDEGRNAA